MAERRLAHEGGLVRMGEGLAADLPRLMAEAGIAARRVLVVADAFLIGRPELGALQGALARAGIEADVALGIAGEPKAATIDALADRARAFGAQALVAVGGGSTLDAAKLAAAVAVRGRAMDYALCANPLPPEPLPLAALPTTAGTGSEVTRTSVVSDAAGRKLWAWGDALRPRLAVLDPILTLSLPPDLTLWTTLDALSHAIEAATHAGRTEAAVGAAMEAVATIAASLERVLNDPADPNGRADLLWGAMQAGRAIDLAGCTAPHALAHALGSLRPAHHGRLVALAHDAFLAPNVAAAPDLFLPVAEAAGTTAAGLPGWYSGLLARTRLKRGFGGEGLDPGLVVAAMLAPENRPMLQANPRPYAADELERLVATLLAA